MSGKCPYCHRIVKSTDQVCTPGVTPPVSPWMAILKSPLRSPLSPRRNPTVGPKSPKAEAVDGGQSPPRSPTRSSLRSPFMGSFFGGSQDHNDQEMSVRKQETMSPRLRQGRSLSPVRGGGRSPAPWDVPEERTTAASLSPRRGSARTPLHGSSVTNASAKVYTGNTRESLYVNVDMADVETEFTMMSPKYNNKSRSRSPTRSPAASGGYNPDSTAATRSPRSTRTPSRSFEKAANSTDDSHQQQQPQQQQQRKFMTRPGGVGSSPKHSRSRSPMRGRSVRGTSSPGPATRGPHSPLHSPYKGSFFDNSTIDADDDEFSVSRPAAETGEGKSPKSRARSRSPLRSPIRSPFADGGLRSPLRSPFNASFFGGGGSSTISPKQRRHEDGGAAPIGSE